MQLMQVIFILMFLASKAMGTLNVRFLKLADDDNHKAVLSAAEPKSALRIYCYPGKPEEIAYNFQTVMLAVEIETSQFMQYEGDTPEEVYQHYEDQHSLFSWTHLFSANRKTEVRMKVFHQTCVGMDTAQEYRVHLNITRVDYWKFFGVMIGVALVLLAPRLSRGTFFYYTVGILGGTLLCLFVIVYFLGKLIPNKKMMIGGLLGGWTVGFYALSCIWSNARTLVLRYQNYVFWYISLAVFVSWMILYRIGPPTNERTLNVIKWSIQGVGIGMVYVSCNMPVVALYVGALLVCYFLVSLRRLRNLRDRWWPRPRRLLTNDEYRREGVVETERGLRDLIGYCTSNMNTWVMLTRLQDVAIFIGFLAGRDHVSREARLEHLRAGHILNRPADDETEDESEEEEQRPRPVLREPVVSRPVIPKPLASRSVNEPRFRALSRLAPANVHPDLSDDE